MQSEMTTALNRWLTTAMGVFVLICACRTASAQEKTKAPQEKITAPDTAAIVEPTINDSTQRARLFLDKIEVLGTIAKPQALFILPGNDPEVEGLQIDRSFFREIFRPVEWEYFQQTLRPEHRRLLW